MAAGSPEAPLVAKCSWVAGFTPQILDGRFVLLVQRGPWIDEVATAPWIHRPSLPEDGSFSVGGKGSQIVDGGPPPHPLDRRTKHPRRQTPTRQPLSHPAYSQARRPAIGCRAWRVDFPHQHRRTAGGVCGSILMCSDGLATTEAGPQGGAFGARDSDPPFGEAWS